MSKASYIIALIPFSVQLPSGEAINERQFLEALARKVDGILVFSLRFLGRKRQKITLPDNIKIVELPAARYFGILLSFLFSLIVSLVVSLITVVFKNVKLIYVRSTWFAFGLLWNRKLASKTLTKFSGFTEDTTLLTGIPKKLLEKLAYVVDKVVLLRSNRVGIPSVVWIKMLYRKRKISLPLRKFLIIPAGVNIRKIKKININKCNPPYQRNATEFKITFLGSLTWWQGVDILIKAFDIVNKRFTNSELIIVGDGPLRGRIEHYAKKRQLNVKVTGYVSHDKALGILSKSYVLVLPRLRTATTEATIPLKVLEAWALGVPVIVTEHEVFKYYGVKNYEHVIFCEPNPQSVAKAICTILDNPSLREKLSMNALKLAKRFDYDNLVGKVLSSCCS